MTNFQRTPYRYVLLSTYVVDKSDELDGSRYEKFLPMPVTDPVFETNYIAEKFEANQLFGSLEFHGVSGFDDLNRWPGTSELAQRVVKAGFEVRYIPRPVNGFSSAKELFDEILVSDPTNYQPRAIGLLTHK